MPGILNAYPNRTSECGLHNNHIQNGWLVGWPVHGLRSLVVVMVGDVTWNHFYPAHNIQLFWIYWIPEWQGTYSFTYLYAEDWIVKLLRGDKTLTRDPWTTRNFAGLFSRIHHHVMLCLNLHGQPNEPTNLWMNEHLLGRTEEKQTTQRMRLDDDHR